MKITKPILLILLATALIVACRNNEVYEDKSKIETLKKEGENKLTETAKEQEEKTAEYLENVDVSEVKVNWQKNLFWFIAQKISQ